MINTHYRKECNGASPFSKSRHAPDIFQQSAQHFPTPLQQFQYFDKYSRFRYDLGRRETWLETVERAVSFLRELSEDKLSEEDYQRIQRAILNMEALPSMRLIAMAGEAARRDHTTIYNCSYTSVDSIDSFVEALLISMAGCGVGFSVESRYVNQLPQIACQVDNTPIEFTIPDTAEGWGEALRLGLESWFAGDDVKFDYSQVRPAGAPLRTKGGRASGPAPLKRLLDKTREIILARQGEKLRPIDAHDIMCLTGGAAVSGGVRRSAQISLFDLDDEEMRKAKNGDLNSHPWRWNANNSAVWEQELSYDEVKAQMEEMIRGGRGEPGIFSRLAAKNTIPKRRQIADFGGNPCMEIYLRPLSFCNLSQAIARPDDTLRTLRDKVEIATILGTIQSTATYFPHLRDEWQHNAEEERLLGVDITGQMDSPAIQSSEAKRHLRQVAIETNARYAKKLGINQSAAVTCNKPSGNSSILLNASPGIHARWAKYYVRNVRVGRHTPLYYVLRDNGVPMDPENGQEPENADTYVAHFPVRSPTGATTRDELTAIEQCENWLDNKLNWAEHNPSVTISYESHEVDDLIDWVYEHQDVIGGMAFLPKLDAKYDQMPYETISELEYERLSRQFPEEIDFSLITKYEHEDLTTATQEKDCNGTTCVFDLLEVMAMGH